MIASAVIKAIVSAVIVGETLTSAYTVPTTNMIGAINIALTVDGFIADKSGGVDWLNNQPQVEGEDFGFGDFLNSVDAIIMGRGTLEVVAGFGKEMWAYRDKPLYVVTSRVENVKLPDWIPSSVQVIAMTSPEEVWNSLESKKYSRIYIDGGRTIQTFLNAGLVHELNLSRVPILLGEGISLFGTLGGTSPRSLNHVSTRSFSNGFVVSKYAVESDEQAET